MAVQAVARSISMSPRKVAVVADLVRGHSVADALVILEHTPRRSALPVIKVIESVRANADHNHSLRPESLQIVSISVTPGARIKRYRPAAHGRALPYQKKSSHITVIVEGEKREVKKPVRKSDDKTAKKETK